MKSSRKSSEKLIDYENIPTQINEKIKGNSNAIKHKDKILNSKYMNNMPKSKNNILFNLKLFQRNTLDELDKKEKNLLKNNNIKTIDKKSIKKNNNINRNKSKSIKMFDNIIIGHNINIQNIHNIKQNVSPDKNPINKSENKRQSSSNKLKKTEDKSAKQSSSYKMNKKNSKTKEKDISKDIQKSNKKITSVESLNKKTKDCLSLRGNHNINNSSFISSITCAKSMSEIEDSINKMYEWEKKRNEKIEKMRNLKNSQINKYTYIPKINKRSNSLAAKMKLKDKNNENIFERLSKEDKVSKEKKKILVELYTPSFQPRIYHSSSKRNNNINKRGWERKDNLEKKESDKIYLIKVNKLDLVRKKRKKDVDNIDEEENKDENDIMQNILRKTIIRNIYNKFRNKNCEN